jgi:alpha-galactosidase
MTHELNSGVFVGAAAGGPCPRTDRAPGPAGSTASVQVRCSAARQAVAVWNPDTAGPTVALPTAPSAALLRITRTEPDAP